MTRLILISILGLFIMSCTSKEEQPIYQAEYTYSLEGWESLGTQTLVLIEANNASSLDQKITFEVDVINADGKVFRKDTTIEFDKTEREKKFQLMIETEGEIKDVKVTSK